MKNAHRSSPGVPEKVFSASGASAAFIASGFSEERSAGAAAQAFQSGRANRLTHILLPLYELGAAAVSSLQSPFLLVVRLYWGWQFVQTGWGKLHHIAKITQFFASLNIPLPGASAHFVAGLEFMGGLFLIAGLGSRLVSLLLAGNMMVAYWTADHDALVSVFSDPGKFYVADPYTFLFASLMVLVFGPGLLSLDALVGRRLRGKME